MELVINFWHWIIAGVLFLIFELLSGSGFLLWIGLAALVVSAIVFVLPSLAWPWQLLCFAVMSIVTCLVWYRHLQVAKKEEKPETLNKRSHQYIGRQFELEMAIVNGRGRVKIGDSIWRVSGEDLPKGCIVKVISVDGVILNVEKSED